MYTRASRSDAPAQAAFAADASVARPLHRLHSMSIILWIVTGVLIGWVASLILKPDQEEGAVLNVVVGVVGALLGGFLLRILGRSAAATHDAISLYSALSALVGASVLIGAMNLVRRRTRVER